MNREQKSASIDALAGELQAAETIIAVDYRGLSVSAAAELRTKLRQADASFRVVKNSLTERAAEKAGVDGLTAFLEGPTALTFVRGDAALAAKAIADQARATRLLPFKGGVMGGDELDPAQLTALARLPARQVLYGQLVGVVASPISGLVRTLNALIGGLAVALGQVREQKQEEAPAAEAAAAEEVSAEEPAAEETPAQEPAAEEPAQEPTAEEPAQEPTAEEPAQEPAQEPAAEEPAAEEPTAEEPAAAETPAQEPEAAEKPAAEEPAQEPAAEETLAQESAAAEPAEVAPADEAETETEKPQEPAAQSETDEGAPEGDAPGDGQDANNAEARGDQPQGADAEASETTKEN